MKRPSCWLLALALPAAAMAADRPSRAELEAAFTTKQLELIDALLAAERSAVLDEAAKRFAERESKAPVPLDPESPELGETFALPPNTSVPLRGNAAIATADRPLQAGDQTAAEIEFAGTEDGEARLVWARSWSGEPGPIARENTWRLQFSAPIDDEENGRAHFGTLDGLANGVGLKFGFSHERTRRIDLGAKVPSDEWQKLCGLSGQEVNGCTLVGIELAAMEPDVGRELQEAYAAFSAQQYGWGKVFDVNIGAARKEFDYYAADFSEHAASRTGWSVGSAFAWITPDRHTLYSVGFDLQQAYKPVDEQILCPDDGTVPFECVAGRFAAPRRRNQHLLWFETRSEAFALPYSLRLTHDLRNDESAVDLPIYFIRPADGGYTGGVRLGWNSEDRFDVGVFIGAEFGVRE